MTQEEMEARFAELEAKSCADLSSPEEGTEQVYLYYKMSGSDSEVLNGHTPEELYFHKLSPETRAKYE